MKIIKPIMTVAAHSRFLFRFVVIRDGGVKDEFEKFGEGSNENEALARLLADMGSLRIVSAALYTPAKPIPVWPFKDQIAADGDAMKLLNGIYDQLTDIEGHPGKLADVVTFAIAQLKTAIEESYPAGDGHEVD